MNVMMKSSITRFLKGFVAGGIAQVIVIVNAGLSISSIADVKAVFTAVIVGFLTGGLLAMQKMLTWKE